jgi:hypothetical protein
MRKPMHWSVRLFALALIVSGCGDNHHGQGQEKALTATATVANVDGHLVRQTPLTEDMEQMKALDAKLAAIDSKYPPPQYDSKAHLYRVIDVRSDDVVLLDGGIALKFDGITCSPTGIDNISKLLLEASARVAFRAAGTGTSPTPAEIWLVDVSEPASPRYSIVSETALKSGWCEPEAATSASHPRYVALATLAHN